MVGCSHLGLPTTVTPQRNLLGAAMSFRRSVFDKVGAFDTDMGRVGSLPLGCEETEFALRCGGRSSERSSCTCRPPLFATMWRPNGRQSHTFSGVATPRESRRQPWLDAPAVKPHCPTNARRPLYLAPRCHPWCACWPRWRPLGLRTLRHDLCRHARNHRRISDGQTWIVRGDDPGVHIPPDVTNGSTPAPPRPSSSRRVWHSSRVIATCGVAGRHVPEDQLVWPR